MTDKSKATWQPTDKQVDKIILPAMQGIAHQCAGYINELECPPGFIAVMLKDVAIRILQGKGMNRNQTYLSIQGSFSYHSVNIW